MGNIVVYKSGLHMGEEKWVVGNQQSGMVYFSGCHLSCDFCYTPETSRDNLGKHYDRKAFYILLEDLIRRGARNINLVSPTHIWREVQPVLEQLCASYKIPLLLKTSGYEGPKTLCRMAQLAHVFVPDFKVWHPESAKRVGLPQNYGSRSVSALAEILKTHGSMRWNEEGYLVHGVLVRHLLMPGFFEDSVSVVEQLGTLAYRGLVNFMTYFIEPVKKTLIQASPREIEILCLMAQSFGMTPLVNGKLVTARQAEVSNGY